MTRTCEVCNGAVGVMPNGELFPHQRYADGAGYGPDQPHALVGCEGGGTPPASAEPLHAHEVTPDDAALIRMLAGAHFDADAKVVLPSGKTITGTEMQRWLEADGR